MSKMKGSRNFLGEESKQSKLRRGVTNHPDPLAGKGSTSDKVKASRKKKKTRMEEILKAMGI